MSNKAVIEGVELPGQIRLDDGTSFGDCYFLTVHYIGAGCWEVTYQGTFSEEDFPERKTLLESANRNLKKALEGMRDQVAAMEAKNAMPIP